jgi:dolichyl-phosphate-mannose--protein O-mannosyl transferase
LPAIIILLLQYNLNHSSVPGGTSLSESIAATSTAVVPQIMLFGMLLLLFLSVVNMLDFAFSKTHTVEIKRYFVPLVLCLLLFSSLWLPWARSPRIMFFYHFFPPMTFMYPLIAYALYTIAKKSLTWRYAVFAYLFIVALSFTYFYPHVTGELMPSAQREAYFWLSSWK